jgi:probable rRNA maturation factor
LSAGRRASATVEITLANRQRAATVDRAELLGFLQRLVARQPPSPADRFAVCLVSDLRMRELNRTFRGVDATTDVLSFPWDGEGSPEGERHLGDILISVPRARSQAERAGHDLDRELKILLIHGYLHLLGHDHETDRGEMSRLQARLVRSLIDSRETETRIG